VPVVEVDADVLERLEQYAAVFAADFGIITRRHWAVVYLQGLLLDGERKSIQPVSQRVMVAGWQGDTEQALQLFVNQSGWDEQALVRRVAVLAGARLLLWAKALALADGSVRAFREWDWWLEALDCHVLPELERLGSAGPSFR
jgi:hypothetical protein